MNTYDSIKVALEAMKDAQMERLINKAQARLEAACEAAIDRFRNNPLQDRQYSSWSSWDGKVTAQDWLGWALGKIMGDQLQTTEFEDHKWRLITKTHWHTNPDGSKQLPATFNAAGFCQHGVSMQVALDAMNKKNYTNFEWGSYEVQQMVLAFLENTFQGCVKGGIRFSVDPFGTSEGNNAVPCLTPWGWLELCGLEQFKELISFDDLHCKHLPIASYTSTCMAAVGKINHTALWARAEKIAADQWAAFENKILTALEAFDIQEIESDPSQAFESGRIDLFITATNGCKFRLSCWWEDCTSVLGVFFIRWQLKFGDLKDPTGNKVKGASKAKALAMIDSH